LDDASMRLFLVRFCRLFVAALVVLNDFARVSDLWCASPAAKDRCASLVESAAYLLGGDVGVFPPAAARCVSRRIPTPPTPWSNGESVPNNPGLRSASCPLLAFPIGTSVPPSSGERQRTIRVPGVRRSHWSGSISLPLLLR